MTNKDNPTFDIIFPIGPNDINHLSKSITYAKKNVIGYRNIFLITTDRLVEHPGCTTIFEGEYPFSKNDIEKTFGTKTPRAGWYLQQLLKLYAFKVIPNLADNYLVIDSDTAFLKPTTFLEDDKALFTTSPNYHHPYFEQMKRLHHTFERQKEYTSGIAHHMMFNKDKLKKLFDLVENKHKQDFWKVFLMAVNKKDINLCGASEYEIYFNFLLKHYPDYIKVRDLKWDNLYELPMKVEGYDYVSVHYYLRDMYSPPQKFLKRIQRIIHWHKLDRPIRKFKRSFHKRTGFLKCFFQNKI